MTTHEQRQAMLAKLRAFVEAIPHNWPDDTWIDVEHKPGCEQHALTAGDWRALVAEIDERERRVEADCGAIPADHALCGR